MPVVSKRREPQDAAITVLQKCGGTVCLGTPEFSAKWLTYYRPLWLVQRLARISPLARLLEEFGLLPKRYVKIAHFDADRIVLTAFRRMAQMKAAGSEISKRMGVEIKVTGAAKP